MGKFLFNFFNTTVGGIILWALLLLLVSGFGTSGWWGGWND